MQNKKKLSSVLKTIFLLLLVFIVSGCSLSLGSTSANNNDSGFFASYDKGSTWIQKSELASVGGNRMSFKSIQSNFLKVDPNDSKAFYLGSNEDGLFYSYNKGDSWQKTLSGKGVIHDIAIDPKYICTLYIAVGNTLYKSIDCLRHFTIVHNESGRSILSVGVDALNNSKIYIGLSDGVILKSENAGGDWGQVSVLSNPSAVLKILINPKDPKKIYVATKDRGIYKSDNEGYEWKNISDNITQPDKKDSEKESLIPGAHNYRNLIFDSTKDDGLLYASNAGLFITDNGGNNWNQIKLISKQKGTNIYAIGINPKNNNEIYYSTSNLLYRSFDGGKEWTTKKLKTTKTIISLIVDSENPNNIFAALRR